ncbi:MAG: dephospho-CoA kinase [Pseudomonadaceae bacterium]|nr:dephospho-CoA kinase [Pseudomonadaceae bacterium]
MKKKLVNNKQSKLIIGLTGGIGSGKTAASDLFAKQGVNVVDTDILARQALQLGSPLLTQVFNYFGEQLKLEDGSLDRAALRALVFNNSTAKTWLEELVHPWVKKETLKALAEATSPYILLSSPLLIESGQVSLTDRLVVVDLPESIQIQRTTQRDNNDPSLVKKIIQQQISRQDRLAQADDLIDNSGDLTSLQKQVDSLHNHYLKLALTKANQE